MSINHSIKAEITQTLQNLESRVSHPGISDFEEYKFILGKIVTARAILVFVNDKIKEG